MTVKSDFTAEQWEAIRNAPQLVTLAAAAAGNSGLFGSVSEGMATASAIVAGARGENALLRDIFDKDGLRAAQEGIRNLLKSVTDESTFNTHLEKAAMDATTAALSALQARGAGADVEAFKAFLKDAAEKVASASKEGGFLGFGGERISEGESAFLAKLDQALA